MFEFRVPELKKGDEFTADNGNSWWRVLRGPHRFEVDAECISAQSGSGYYAGQKEGFAFLRDDRVIVR